MQRIIESVGFVWIALGAVMVLAQTPAPKERARVGTPPLTIKTPSLIDRLQTSTRQHEWAEIESAGSAGGPDPALGRSRR